TLAVCGLFAQLVLVQRFQLSARLMIQAGVALMVAAFGLFVVGGGFATYLLALASLGVGLGLVRPGTAAAASLSVGPNEQGAAAGLVGGVAVIGNVFGPMLGTTLYEMGHTGPYILNGVIMTAILIFLFANSRLRNLKA